MGAGGWGLGRWLWSWSTWFKQEFIQDKIKIQYIDMGSSTYFKAYRGVSTSRSIQGSGCKMNFVYNEDEGSNYFPPGWVRFCLNKCLWEGSSLAAVAFRSVGIHP